MRTGGLTEHNQINQRIGTKSIGTMHGHASCFAHGHKSLNGRVGIAVLQHQGITGVAAWNAAHVVVNGGKHRDRLLGYIHTGKDPGALRDPRQALMNDLRIQMRKMQVDMVLVRPDAATFAKPAQATKEGCPVSGALQGNVQFDLDAKLDGDQSPRGWGLFLIRNMVDAMDVTEIDIDHAVAVEDGEPISSSGLATNVIAGVTPRSSRAAMACRPASSPPFMSETPGP